VASWSALGSRPAAAQWSGDDKIIGSTIGGLDEFGYAVGISGTATIVGARNDDDLGTDAGAAYIFRQSGSSWFEEDKLLASDGAAGDRFGQAVALSGNVAVIGAYLDDASLTDCGSAYVFRFNGSQWNQEAKLTASDRAAADYFGWAVSIDGNVIAVGAYGEDDGGTSAGAVYVFNYNGSSWVQEARLKASDADASDYFGVSVGISGTRVVVGAYLDEQAAGSAGSAYIFKDLGTTWTQEAKLLPAGLGADDRFGHAVAISNSGNVAVIGALHDDDTAIDAGAAYVFERNNTVWPLSAKIKASDGAAGDKFGTAVAASLDVIVVGAYWDDAGSLTDSGAAYVFRDTGSWTQEDKVVASDPYYWEFFGNAVAVSNGKVVVGAYNDNSGGMDAGAVYVFIEGGSGPACDAVMDCADVDGDGIRDDKCTWWACDAGTCLDTAVQFADLGGAFGGCQPDGTADGNDRFHALTCFSNMNTTGNPGYPCEDSPPWAYNVDAGGSFGDCDPDGICDGNDAFHAINAFQGSTTCSCPSGPAPAMPQVPSVIAAASVQLQLTRESLRPGEGVEVEVFLVDPLDDLRGYQLHLGVSGGKSGTLELIDIAVDDRKDAAYSGFANWQAFNVQTAQMVAGLDDAGVATVTGAYLATFTFTASPDASGAFTIELLHDDQDRSHRTFLFPTAAGAKIAIQSAEPVVIAVEPDVGRGR
jgi:hypothetical protein